MCRLLGIKANRPVDLTFSLMEAPDSLRVQSGGNRDGWGLAAWGGDGWCVSKRPVPAAADPGFREAAIQAEGSIIIGHVRYSSVGGRSLENTHPFRHGTWVFAHNGTLRGSDRLLPAVSPALAGAVLGTTDSERFFFLALSRIEARAGGLGRGLALDLLLDALRDAVDLAGHHCDVRGLNFLISDGDRLIAHRLGNTLYWLDRRSPSHDRVAWTSPRTRALLESKALSGERTLLVASEPLTGEEEPWEEVPEGRFVVFTSNVKVRRA